MLRILAYSVRTTVTAVMSRKKYYKKVKFNKKGYDKYKEEKYDE